MSIDKLSELAHKYLNEAHEARSTMLRARRALSAALPTDSQVVLYKLIQEVKEILDA